MTHQPTWSVVLGVLGVVGSSAGVAQDWSSWERQHAVGRYGEFLVIKQPGEGFCYATQSYESDPSKMTLSLKGETPSIATPFFRGIDGAPVYWVDDGSKRQVASAEVTAAGSFRLSPEVVGELRAGQVLYVQVKPTGEPSVTQEFSLRGFTAVSRMLSSPACTGDGGAQASEALEVTLTRTSGGAVVAGKTTLPNGMSLMISLRASDGGYFAQDTVRVSSGAYRSAAFSDRGSPLPAGSYRVSISSPLMGMQPELVKRALGDSGKGIPKEIREKSDFGEAYTVRYSVVRALD
jgi:hypothetical protein